MFVNIKLRSFLRIYTPYAGGSTFKSNPHTVAYLIMKCLDVAGENIIPVFKFKAMMCQVNV